MVRTHSLRLLAAALLFAAGTVQADSLAQLKQFMDGTRSARGSFFQQVFSKSGRKPQQASGTFAFSRPGKFRWTYDKPYYQLLVGDGEKLWVHDRDLNQVTVKTLGDALASTPAALLAGAVALLARELPYKLGLMLAALAGVLGGLWVESLGERPAQQGPA